MAIHLYHCDDCDHTQEHSVKMDDPPLQFCPKCGSNKYKKRFPTRPGGFSLKGGGWFDGGYKGKGEP